LKTAGHNRRDDEPSAGTFSATSDGTSVSIEVFFRSQRNGAHDLELRPRRRTSVVGNTMDALLIYSFGNAPPIEAGIQINLPAWSSPPISLMRIKLGGTKTPVRTQDLSLWR